MTSVPRCPSSSRDSPKPSLFVDAPPFACLTHQTISREEAASLELRIRRLVGAQASFSVPPLPRMSATTRTASRPRTLSVYEWKDLLAEKIKQNILLVCGHPLKVMLEQSPQRRAEYSQNTKALGQHKQEIEIDAHKWEPCGRALRIYAAPTWQESNNPALTAGSGTSAASRRRSFRP